MTRTITMEGEPVADLVDIVPLTYLDSTDLKVNFRGSVLDILLERGKPVLATSRTEIVAADATGEIAQRLEIVPGTALLKLVAQLYSYDE